MLFLQVCLIQEQLSKNRIILEHDPKGNVSASVTSSTHERKSRTVIALSGGRVHLQHNTIGDDIPIVVSATNDSRRLVCRPPVKSDDVELHVTAVSVAICCYLLQVLLRALGICSDQEICTLVGPEPELHDALQPSLEEAAALGLFSQHAALEFIGGKVQVSATSCVRHHSSHLHLSCCATFNQHASCDNHAF